MGIGTDNDATVFSNLVSSAGAIVGPGVYRIGSTITIDGHLRVEKGGMIRPDTGVTIKFAPGSTIEAGEYQIFDHSLGGSVDGTNLTGWAKSSWFPGGSPRDLSQQINNASAWGFYLIEIPPAVDHRMKTTVRLGQGLTLRLGWCGEFRNRIICETDGKPVFEAVGGIRDWRIVGGNFHGAGVKTPSCFLLTSWGETGGGQCGDCPAISDTYVRGTWGVAAIINISGEVMTFTNNFVWNEGKGDATWAGPTATIIIANADYWDLPYTYAQPNRHGKSCSANVFQNCDIRGSIGPTILLKGQVEDTAIIATYLNSQGLCGILTEPGVDSNGVVTCPRRLYLGGGGRSETNLGTTANDGIPVIIVRGENRPNMGLYLLTMGEMGHFVGARGNSTPAIKTESGGMIYGLTLNQGCHIEYTNVLLDHKTADLNWATIVNSFAAIIDCTGRSINDSTVHSRGRVIGTRAASSQVRAPT